MKKKVSRRISELKNERKKAEEGRIPKILSSEDFDRIAPVPVPYDLYEDNARVEKI